jgi:Protein of unknown function (DUF3489)/DDE superfamily endonuclease
VVRRLRAEGHERQLIVLGDGAPDHRANAVREVATTLGIELMPRPGYSPDRRPVEALWRWLREDVTSHHCQASAEDLTRRVAEFEARLNRDPFVVADRLWVKDHLDPDEEKLRFSNSTRFRRKGKAAAAEKSATPSSPVRQPRAGTKQELLIAMLTRPEGATVPEVVAATGWQPHTFRGAFAGALKKKLGLEIRSDKVDGRGRVYRTPN